MLMKLRDLTCCVVELHCCTDLFLSASKIKPTVDERRAASASKSKRSHRNPNAAAQHYNGVVACSSTLCDINAIVSIFER